MKMTLEPVAEFISSSESSTGGKKRKTQIAFFTSSSRILTKKQSGNLRLRFEEALPLTNAVFVKTMGNPFFTRQALEHLVLKNALYYDTISFRWDWKLQENELKDLISDDLLDMIKVKIEHLEPKLQEVLMTASCTMSTFDVDTILVLLNPKFVSQGQAGVGDSKASEEEYEEEKLRLSELFNQAEGEGLLVKAQVVQQISTLEYSTRASNIDEYAFAHDKIQETARRLVSSAHNEFEYLERVRKNTIAKSPVFQTSGVGHPHGGSSPKQVQRNSTIEYGELE